MALDLPEGSKDGWLDGDGDKVVSYRIQQLMWRMSFQYKYLNICKGIIRVVILTCFHIISSGLPKKYQNGLTENILHLQKCSMKELWLCIQNEDRTDFRDSVCVVMTWQKWKRESMRCWKSATVSTISKFFMSTPIKIAK